MTVWAPTSSAPARYHCANCHHRAQAPGPCPRCPDEPLLDLADEEVRLMLDQADDATKYRHAGKLIGLSAAAGVPLTIALMMLSGTLGLDLNPIQMMFGSSLAVMFALFALWKPNKSAPALSEGEIEALEGGHTPTRR